MYALQTYVLSKLNAFESMETQVGKHMTFFFYFSPPMCFFSFFSPPMCFFFLFPPKKANECFPFIILLNIPAKTVLAWSSCLFRNNDTICFLGYVL